MIIRGALGGLLVVLWGCSASAAEAPRKLEPSASLLLGVGAGDSFEDSSMVRYGLGFGGRVGLTLPSGVYLGASFLHFEGSESRAERMYTNTLDLEAGYEFRLIRELLVIRPQLALGAVQPVTIQPDNAAYPLALHAAPGVLVGLRLKPLLISVEARRDFVFDRSWPDATTGLLGAGVVL